MKKSRQLNVAVIRAGALRNQDHVTTLCQFLVANDFRVSFFSLQASQSDVDWFRDQVPGIQAFAVGRWPGLSVIRFIKGGLKLRSRLKQTQFDILYLVDSWTLPYAFVATLGRIRLGDAATVYHSFDMITGAEHGRAYFALERYVARSCRLNINTDRARAEIARLIMGLKETPLAIPLRLSVNANLPKRDETLRASILKDRENGKILVVYPTALRADRVSKEVILAVAALPDRYHLASFDAEGCYAQECRELIAERGLQERVHLLQRATHEDVVKLCACADVGLIFHDMDAGIGNYFCHPGRLAYYVALGLPLVASNVPVVEALVYKFGLGACCSPYEPLSIAAEIQGLVEGPVSLEERARQIRAAFRQEMYYERSAAALAVALRRLAAPRVEQESDKPTIARSKRVRNGAAKD